MNTSKQVNLMLGLLFLVVLALGLYFVWDENLRAEDAALDQVRDNAERGAFLFARNCRVCHGVTGTGTLENVNLPGLPLNVEGNRDPDRLKEIQARFADTIVCGRVGTLMPPWHTAQGGPLNDFQIEQLVTLITGATADIGPPAVDNDRVSREAWEHAVEFAEEADTLLTPEGEEIQLTQAADSDDIVLTLNSVSGLAADTLLRLDNPDLPPEKDEVVRVVQVPVTTELAAAALKEDTSIIVRDASGLQRGMIIRIDEEHLRVVSVQEPDPLITVRARAAFASIILVPTRVQVQRGVEGTRAAYHKPAAAVADTDTQIRVERAAFGTQAVAHSQGTHVFAGPILPPEGPLTSATCGQRAAAAPTPAGPPAPTPSPGQPERPATAQTVSGEPEPPLDSIIETETQDNFFTRNNFRVALGQTVTIRVTNSGQNPHNFHVAGLDGQWDTDDDFVIPPLPDLLLAGESGEGTFSLDQEATLVFRCDVHPTEMWGQITVSAQ